MRYKALSGTIGAITLLFMFTFLPPFFVGAMYPGESLTDLYITFIVPFFITLIVGSVLFFLGRDEIESVREREAVVAVALSWLLMALLGSLPYLFSGILTNPADAFFESMSGFATCGATVIGLPPSNIVDPSSIQYYLADGTPFIDYMNWPNAHSIFLWRSLTQWVGGMGIIVFSVVIISKLLGGTVQLFKAEAPGETVTRIKPKIQQTASVLLRIYLLFTAVEAILLWGAGMSPYDAVNHSFTTLATGGFGTHAQSITYYQFANENLYVMKDGILVSLEAANVAFHYIAIESIIIVFMILGSISFVLHYKVMGGKVNAILKDPELRLFFFSLLFFTLIISFTLAGHGLAELDANDIPIRTYDPGSNTYLINYTKPGGWGFDDAFRYGAFNTVSIHSTTGYANSDFGLWPQSAQLALVMMMIMGGCVGSTAGAIKISRILILAKVARREIQKVLHPRAIIPIRMGGSVVSEEVVKKVGVFFFAYLGLFFISSLIMSFYIDDISVAFSAVATTMGGVGPGIGTGAGTLGPSQIFAPIPATGKIYLSLCMWAGRLEIFSAIILFFPNTYRK